MTMITPSYLGETIEYSSLHACRSTLEDPTKVIATGGLAPSLSKLIPVIDIVDERLTLHGLRLIHDQNR